MASNDGDSARTNAPLRFGWFIPTYGDAATLTPGADDERIPPGIDLFVDVAEAAERAGFDYALVPVAVGCWEAWISCAMVAARTTKLKLLVAARPGYIVPTMMAKMISTFDQLTNGRIYINLIAGGSTTELAADGIYYGHDERYEIMDEGVEIMKRVWTEPEPVTFRGKHFDIQGAVVRPAPLQQPYPRFYIGGESEAAREVGAKHADVFFFWGDTPENTAEKIVDIRARAERQGRGGELTFGMRLQIVVRDTEEEAWASAWSLIEGATDEQRTHRATVRDESQADRRMWTIANETDGYRVAPHLWSGISTIRTGAGMAVVGNPQQVADTLQQFVDIGCTEFCLSGYPHAREAERFGRLVMPLFADQLVASAAPA